ncbi:MAG: PAS domain-containing sensor histidine kinase [Saprospiraceae bacterium]|nr:PAS domain-containing sensor histidine kinase [Candidatus Vicinibacter affinis]
MNPDIHQYFNDSNFLVSVFNTAIDGVIVIDHRGRMLKLNESASNLFRYPQEELIGKNVNMLIPEPDHSKHDGYIQNYLQTGVKKIIGIGREVTGLKKDGTLFPMRLAISQIDVDGIIFFTGIVHDLSAQKESEKKLQNLTRSLEDQVQSRTGQLQETINQLSATNRNLEEEIEFRKSVERRLKLREQELLDSLEKERDLGILKSRFVSIASHEFRTPLANILSSISLISKYDTNELLEKRNSHIEKIKKNIHYLNGILNEFLTLTRIEEGKFELKPQDINLVELITELIEDFSAIKKKDQRLTLVYKPGFDDLVYSDKSCLKHILNNVISNAYSGEGSLVEISLQSHLDSVAITVNDEGIGIPDEEKKFIFDIFFRGTNVLNIQGTGLGLNIVKKYLDSINGSISFSSVQPKGTKVSILIPRYVKEI